MRPGAPEDGGRRAFLRAAALGAASLGPGSRRILAAASGSARSTRVVALASALRQLYAQPGSAPERWGRAPLVRLPDGRELPREQAYRDDAQFVEAAGLLIEEAAEEPAALGAWLASSALPGAHAAAAARLLGALRRGEGLAAFEAARGLALVGSRAELPALEACLRALPAGPTRSAAAWSAERLGGARLPAGPAGPLPSGFGRGACWWYEGLDGDRGRASFAELRRLGVDWISIHTWDPLQRAVDDPRLEPASRLHGPQDLPGVVAEARAAGLRVLYKPHLELGHARLAPEQRALLRGPDGVRRRELIARLAAARAARGWHGDIEMRSERDWGLWFSAYGEYVLEQARRARLAGCDAFCVGRELDRTVRARERDWRRLIERTRAAFPRALTYSAHHAAFDTLGFWDALDAVGVAAYFPLAAGAAPSDSELLAGADAALARLTAFARRCGRSLWLTEAGYPALPTAARRPWDEPRAGAEPWLQARCWQALLEALLRAPEIGGLFAWLWEGVSLPPWRDPSFTLKDKPAAFVLARYFRGLGSP